MKTIGKTLMVLSVLGFVLGIYIFIVTKESFPSHDFIISIILAIVFLLVGSKLNDHAATKELLKEKQKKEIIDDEHLLTKINDVYISYTNNNKELALEIFELLEKNNVNCYFARYKTNRYSDDEINARALEKAKIILLIADKEIYNSKDMLADALLRLENQNSLSIVYYTEEINFKDSILEFRLATAQKISAIKISKEVLIKIIIRKLKKRLNITKNSNN